MISKCRSLSRMLSAFVLCTTLLLSAPPSWSEPVLVKAGDRVNVHFTCRLKSGEVAASSYPAVATDEKVRKSAIFVPRTVDTPLSIVAASPALSDKTRGLEDEILNQLSGAVIGMPVGEKQTREIKAERLMEEKKGDYVLQIARVRSRVKEMRFTPEEYKSRTGKAAELGRPFVIDPAVPGKVASLTPSEVVVRFFAHSGDKVATPFGEGIVRELPDRYEIVIDARPGALVRSGGLTGRITSVDDRFISLDYGHPFGGEALLCDVLVESVQ